MLDRFRIPILFVTACIFLYGTWTFFIGKQAVDTERRNRKPMEVTLDDLILNPPKEYGKWIRITDGGASIPRSYFEDYNELIQNLDKSKKVENAPFFLYAPILGNKDANVTETSELLQYHTPGTYIVLRVQKKELKQLYKMWEKVKGSDKRTTDAWLKQNKDAMIIHPPFTGLLVRGERNAIERLGARHVNAVQSTEGYVLMEGETPPMVENPQVAIGLALMMGVPTFWLFALLITGKLAPPDEETLPLERRPTETHTPEMSSDSASVMPSAMPVADEPENTKKPRR